MPKTQSETSVRLPETARVYGPIDPERLGQAFEASYKAWKRAVIRSRGGDPEDAIQSAMVLLLEGTVQVPADATDEDLFGVQKKHLGTVVRLARVLNRPGPRVNSSEEWAHRPRVTRRRLLDARTVQRAVDEIAKHPDWLWRYMAGDSVRMIQEDAGVDSMWIYRSVRRWVRALAHQLPDVLREGRQRWFKESHQRVRALLA